MPARGLFGVLRQRIAALDHEVVDDAMEAGAVVELLVGELLEIGNRTGSFFIEELDRDGALVGIELRGL